MASTPPDNNSLMPTSDFSLLGSGYTVYMLGVSRPSRGQERGWCIAGPTEPDLNALWYEYSGQNDTNDMAQKLPEFINWLRVHKGFVQFERAIQILFEGY